MITAYQVLKKTISNGEYSHVIKKLVVMNIQGHALSSDSRTRVILNVWPYYGGGHKPNGMYAMNDYISDLEDFLQYNCSGVDEYMDDEGDHLRFTFDLKRGE